MGKLGQRIGAEFLKLHRTWLMWMHIVIPAAGITVFLLYYRFSAFDDWGKISAYVQALATVSPALVGVICALAAEQEKEAGRFQNLLGIGRSKGVNLAGKLLALLGANFVALGIAAVGFGALFSMVSFQGVKLGAKACLILTLLLWSPQIFSYCFHLFLGLRFSKGITIGVGIVESLLGALLLTGLGDRVWQWVPSAWAGRLTGIYLLHTGGTLEVYSSTLLSQTALLVGMTLAALIALFIWVRQYEGAGVDD